MTLSRDQIVDAAIGILDSEGPDALSMRRLGTELGAGAASVYWHVSGKDELLDLVADRVIGEVLLGIGSADTWRAWMAAFARSMRRVLLAHPGAAPIVGRRAAGGPNALLALEALFGLLAREGFETKTSLLASTTLVGWTTALVLAEVSEARDGAGPLIDAGPVAPDHPVLVALLGSDSTPTADERFDYGLGVLLDGIEGWEARRLGGAGPRSA